MAPACAPPPARFDRLNKRERSLDELLTVLRENGVVGATLMALQRFMAWNIFV
jgi:hypothetical protein